jgi:import inner membrane translocase subunit TIM8
VICFLARSILGRIEFDMRLLLGLCDAKYLIVLRINFKTLVFLQQEKQKAVLNELVGKLTDVCWDKCITSTPGSKFSSSESSCLTNCAQRFLETSSLILRRFQSLQQ